MKKKILFIIVLLVWFLPAGALASPVYSQLVVFGDSLSDSGNNAVLFGSERTSLPLKSSATQPTAPYPSERYSNGPVWVEQLAADLGLSAKASLLGGTNYAYGGARVWPPVSQDVPLSLPSQVDRFLDATGGKVSSESLYVIEGGANDAQDALAADSPAARNQIIDQYRMNISSIITDLAGAGATDFLIWNVPDIGLAPVIQKRGQPAIGAAISIAQTMNSFLDMALARLERNWPIDIYQFDAFGLTQAVVNNPKTYGLVNVSDPCAVSLACIKDPDDHFFWDGIHPTTAGHRLIAQAVLQVLPHAVPAPGSLDLLALGLLGMGWLGRREGRSSSPRPRI